METIRELIKRPVVVGVVGGIIGILIGMFFAWVVWPPTFVDADPSFLRADFMQDYLRMAIDSHALRADPQLAKQRYDILGEAGPEALAAIQSNPDKLDPATITNFTNAANAVVQPVEPAEEGEPETAPPAEEGTAPLPSEEEAGGRSSLLTLLLVFCGVTLVLGALLVGAFLLRNRFSTGIKTPTMQAVEAAQQAEWTDFSAMGDQAPIAQFMASYKIGDDLFDDSFSVDSASGEFLGECGVGISETIGVGDPKKVTAFEVWLFDKNDIQTVTKVMMSAHAYGDNSMRQRLAAKGEPVLIEPGTQTVLETATLRLVARVVDMNYGEGALPEKSFFDGLILELAVWQL
jgi:hypothetical protein